MDIDHLGRSHFGSSHFDSSHLAVKEWRCECNVVWHICSKHKYAKAHDYETPSKCNATIGQPSPASNQSTMRKKIRGQFSLSIVRKADDDRVRANKRKRSGILDSVDQRPSRRTVVDVHIDLKRKREHDHNDLIDRGPTTQGTLTPTIYSSNLRRRLTLGSSPSG